MLHQTIIGIYSYVEDNPVSFTWAFRHDVAETRVEGKRFKVLLPGGVQLGQQVTLTGNHSHNLVVIVLFRTKFDMSLSLIFKAKNINIA